MLHKLIDIFFSNDSTSIHQKVRLEYDMKKKSNHCCSNCLLLQFFQSSEQGHPEPKLTERSPKKWFRIFFFCIWHLSISWVMTLSLLLQLSCITVLFEFGFYGPGTLNQLRELQKKRFRIFFCIWHQSISQVLTTLLILGLPQSIFLVANTILCSTNLLSTLRMHVAQTLFFQRHWQKPEIWCLPLFLVLCRGSLINSYLLKM